MSEIACVKHPNNYYESDGENVCGACYQDTQTELAAAQQRIAELENKLDALECAELDVKEALDALQGVPLAVDWRLWTEQIMEGIEYEFTLHASNRNPYSMTEYSRGYQSGLSRALHAWEEAKGKEPE